MSPPVRIHLGMDKGKPKMHSSHLLCLCSEGLAGSVVGSGLSCVPRASFIYSDSTLSYHLTVDGRLLPFFVGFPSFAYMVSQIFEVN